MTDDALERLERDGWDALVAGGAEARRFYDDVLTADPTMLLPGGLVLRDRDLMLQTMGDSPWRAYELDGLEVAYPGPDTGLVTYGAVADRGGESYTALMSSLYGRQDGRWRLAFHQQTPRHR